MGDKLSVVGVNNNGFGIIPKLVMQDRDLHISAKAVYAYFCSYAGAGSACFPERKKICYDLCISQDTLSKYLKSLSERGYISIEQVKENGRFSHNVYTLNSTISPCPKISDTERTEYEKLDTNNNSSNNNNIFNNNKEIKKERKKEQSSFDEIIEAYSEDEEIKSLLREWLKIRKLKRAALTDRALNMNLNKLESMAQQSGMTIKQYLEEVICRGWQAFYPIKQYGAAASPKPAEKPKSNLVPDWFREKY